MDNHEYKKFYIVKNYIDSQLSKKSAYLSKVDINRGIDKVGLQAKVLAELLLREVAEHNASIHATRTRLKNLKYKDHRTYQSKLIIGNNVPFRRIDELLKDNPDLEWYEIEKMIFPTNQTK